MSGPRRFTVWHAGVLLLAIVTAVAITWLFLEQGSHDPVARVAATRSTPQVTPGPRAVWLGDSYTEGPHVTGPQRFVSIVSAAMNWTAINQGQGGTGYLKDAPSESTQLAPFAERTDQVLARHPGYVILAGGANDAGEGYSTPSITSAVDRTVTAIRRGAPHATLIVIGPFWWTGTPDRDVVRVNRIVKTETAKLGVRYFLDPIDEHWITDRNRAELIGPDGVHPTVAGHAHIADRILADLHSMGVRPSRP